AQSACPQAPPWAASIAFSLAMKMREVKSSPRIRSGLSGEAAFMDGHVLFVLAIGTRGNDTGWIRLFRQPAADGFGGSVNGLSHIDKILQGGVLHYKKRLGAAKIDGSLYEGTVRKSSQSTRYRRCTIYVSTAGRRAPQHTWGVTASLLHRRSLAFGSQMLDSQADNSTWTEERLGLRWEFAGGMNLSHRAHMELRLTGEGRLAGMTASSGGGFSCRWGEIAYRLTNYSLRTPACGYVSRPGIGPFEHMSFVYGKGSDVSLRLKLWFCSWFEILVYYGQPWQKEERLYVGIKYPR
ncbi:MAG: hypothetical protein ABIA59_07885, partial [Candidatus Latescibacterota bacterium]